MNWANAKLIRLVVAVLLLSGAAASSFAGEAPVVDVRLSSSDIYQGESVECYVTLKNVQNASAPDMSAYNVDFAVTFLGDQPQNQSSIFIVNGRKTENQTYAHLYAYRLTPKKSGTLQLPAPVFSIDGQKITGDTAQLRVQTADNQDFVLMELEVSKPRVFPTQTFDVNLRILVKPLPNDKSTDPLGPLQRQPPAIEINWLEPPPGLSCNTKNEWLQKFVTDRGSGFSLNGLKAQNDISFFFDRQNAIMFSLFTGRQQRTGLDGSKIDYFVYELKRTFTADKAGSYTFGPASVKGQFVDAVVRKNYTGRRVVAFSQARTIDVREVPAPRPTTFSGGIGSYNLAASANPTTLRVGDPLTLTLEVQRRPGSGALELISAPDLSANEKLAGDFDIIDKAPTGIVKGDRKSFSYGLRPKRAGASLPAVTMTVFDPETEKFTDLASAPIALNITQTTQLNAGELVGALPSSQTKDIKSRDQGIFQNVTDVNELADQHVNAMFYAICAAGVWGLVGGMSLLLTSWRRKSNDAAWQRRARARRTADQNLAEARKALADSRTKDVLRGVRDSLVGLIADMRNISASGMTAHEADAALASASIAPQTRQDAVRLLESIEAAEFGSAASQDLKAMLDSATAITANLYRELEARS